MEFIEIKDSIEYENYCKDEKIAVKDFFNPGLSFSADKSLKKTYEDNKGKFSRFDISFSHKNYDWKNESKEHLAGWNFVEFNDNFLPQIPLFFLSMKIVILRRNQKLKKKMKNWLHIKMELQIF